MDISKMNKENNDKKSSYPWGKCDEICKWL